MCFDEKFFYVSFLSCGIDNKPFLVGQNVPPESPDRRSVSVRRTTLAGPAHSPRAVVGHVSPVNLAGHCATRSAPAGLAVAPPATANSEISPLFLFFFRFFHQRTVSWLVPFSPFLQLRRLPWWNSTAVAGTPRWHPKRPVWRAVGRPVVRVGISKRLVGLADRSSLRKRHLMSCIVSDVPINRARAFSDTK